MFGLVGKILRVNLSERSMREEEIREEAAKKFLGGRGLAAKILFEELKPGIDPLGPENKLIFATGPVTGYPFPGNARYAVCAKSPLTGGWGEAYAAGFFGPELKFAGFDAIVFEGQAKQPVYLWLSDSETELRNASNLWGRTTGETQSIIRSDAADESVRVASIGPGGEHLVRFACVLSDLRDAAGRCGMGAVMGSKKLKAVAVRGRKKLEYADKKRFMELAKKAIDESSKGWGKGLHEHGTIGDVDDLHAMGILPTKYFRKSTFDGNRKITGETMTETILIKREPCYACSVACKRVVRAKEPYAVDPIYGGPEYETAASFGSLCMNDDLVSIAKANELCNKYSIDTISTGSAVAFAMECYEKGLLTKEDTDGLDLTWGNQEAIVGLVEKIARREGLGDLLAEGVKRAAEKIGGGAETFALHVKGMELPMHEPRGKKSVGLSYATSNRGACHVQSHHDENFESDKCIAHELGLEPPIVPRSRTDLGKEKVRFTVISQNWMGFLNSGVFCRFTPYPAGISVGTVVGIFSSVTGWNMTPSDMLAIGERAWNLCRAFNVREGMSRADDTLPERLGEPLPEGAVKGETITKDALEQALDEYYALRGWSKEGIPTRGKLEELGLDHVANELWRLGSH